MKTYLKPLSIGFAGAILGGFVLLIGKEAYKDHQIVQALLQIEQQRQQVVGAQR